jgi:predicted NUDIX family phosphoesterase
MSKILVIPENRFSTNLEKDDILSLIDECGIYLDRDYAETNPDFLQIIPYVVVTRGNDQIFTYTRLKKGAEARLHNNRSIGIGGHVEKNPNLCLSDNAVETAVIELNEELDIEDSSTLQVEETGITIFDPTNDVGRVHLGLVFTCDVGDRNVTVRETEKIAGDFYTIAQLQDMYNNNEDAAFENWTKIVLKHKGIIQ